MAELRPDEVAILAAANSEQSVAVAKYYAKTRGIPPENICSLEMPAGETLPREKWSAEIRPAIRTWLQEDGRQTKIRCITTVWDVPLRIGAATDPIAELRQEFLKLERIRRIELFVLQIAELKKLAPDAPWPNETDAAGTPGHQPSRPGWPKHG